MFMPVTHKGKKRVSEFPRMELQMAESPCSSSGGAAMFVTAQSYPNPWFLVMHSTSHSGILLISKQLLQIAGHDGINM